MDRYSIVYSPAAKEDLFGIYSYIATQLLVPQTAANQVNRIRNTIRSLEHHPRLHSIVDWEPWLSLGMRKLPVNNYIVFYYADETAKEVRIVRIVYGGRDLKNILKDTPLEE